MSTTLLDNSYGAARVRLLKVSRAQDRHDLKELSVGIQFEGEFAASYTAGDNRSILPADTIKNTVYALAKLYTIDAIEEFAQSLIQSIVNSGSKPAQGGALTLAVPDQVPGFTSLNVLGRCWV